MDSISANFIHTDTTESFATDTTESFLAELSKLSRKHGIGINEHGVLFVMEPIDMQLTYTIGEEGNITLF